ncbi:hypothetical protein ACHAXR_005631 [Thalassiosira sp. AJA248-18]
MGIAHFATGAFAPTRRRLAFTSATTSTPTTKTSPPSSALALSDNTNPSSSLPFFAAPTYSSSADAQQQQPPAAAASAVAASSTPQSATVTLRLPLGTLFDGRDYIFVTESNVRGYEWTTKETDILMDDLMDAALGNLGGKLTAAASSDGGGSDISSDGTKPTPPPAIITDYELSQIVLVPTSDWDSNLLGLGNRYDVYDGQQRLVTLNLLLAGLRDSFQREAEELNSGKNKKGGASGGKRAVALAATAIEISGMLTPTKVRKEDVKRITLRKRDNVLLEKILVGGNNNDDDGSMDGNIGDGSGEEKQQQQHQSSLISPSDYTKLSPKGRSTLLSPLSPANARIYNNFVHLSNRLSLLTTRERLRLLDYIVERVYLLVCIPETSRIARNIVMSQGRKGMDNESVDDFKGLVCFRYTLEEEDMYQTFDMWDDLAAEPSFSSLSSSLSSSDGSDPAGNSSTIQSVGRDIISSTCLLRASASLRTKIRSRGGDEVYEWERWLRQELWLKNQRLSQQQAAQQSDSASVESAIQPWQGKQFFVQEIKPASLALYKFRTGQWDEFAFLSKTGKQNITKKQRDAIVSRLNFLRDITMGVTSTKEAEIVILELLLRAEDTENGGSMLSRYLDEILPLIETWTLWMALARPSPMQRHARVFALLDAMDDFDSVGSSGLASSSGDGELAKSLRECMDQYEFGATAGGKRLAAAILQRMNAHLMLEEKKSIPDGVNDAATVDLIQHHWPNEEDREEWANRIGNLALVSSTPRRSSRGAKKTDSSWESKRKRYKKERWLLTKQLAELDQWDAGAVKDQQQDLLSMMDLVWNLGSKGG